MRNMKIWIGGAAVICVAVAVFATSLRGGGAVVAAPSGPPAKPVPVVAVIKRTIPVSLEYSARTESIREVCGPSL